MEDVKVRPLELKKLGNQYFETGDYKKAIAYYDEALILDPQNAMIYFNRGLCYFKQCLWQDALKDAISASNLDQSYHKAWFLRARAHYKDGNSVASEIALHRLFSLRPQFQDAEELLSIIIEEKFHKLIEENHLKKWVDTYEMRTLKEAIKFSENDSNDGYRQRRNSSLRIWYHFRKNPDPGVDVDVLPWTIGQFCLKLGDYRLALTCFHFACLQQNKNPGVWEPLFRYRDLTLHDITEAHMMMQEFQEARTFCELALSYYANDPFDPMAVPHYYNLGGIKLRLKLYQESIDVLSRAEIISESSSEMDHYIGRILSEKGDSYYFLGNGSASLDCHMRAEKYLENHQDPIVHINNLLHLALDYLSQKQYTDVHKYLDLALELDKNSENLTRVLSQKSQTFICQAGMSKNESDKESYFNKALLCINQTMERALQLNEKEIQTECHFRTSAIHSMKGELDQAERSCRKAIEIAQESCCHDHWLPHLMKFLAFLFYRKEKFNECIDTIRKAEHLIIDIEKHLNKDITLIPWEQTFIESHHLLLLSLISLYKPGEALLASEEGRVRAMKKGITYSFQKGFIDLDSIIRLVNLKKLNLIFISEIDLKSRRTIYVWLISHKLEIVEFYAFPDGNASTLIAKELNYDEMTSKKDCSTDASFNKIVRSFPVVLEFERNSDNIIDPVILEHNLNIWNRILLRSREKIIDLSNSLPVFEKFILIPESSFYYMNPFISDDYGTHMVFSIVPSLTSLFLQQPVKISSENSCLLVANPRGDLPFAEEESDIVGDQIIKWKTGWNVMKLYRNKALKEHICERLHQSRIIHIAAHGSLLKDETSLVPGALLLAESGRHKPHESLLHATELGEMDLSGVDLMFLNCCLTGEGEIISGGLVGLARACLRAGVKQVVVYKGLVPDNARTVQFIEKFYQLYEEKQADAAEALHFTKLWAMVDAQDRGFSQDFLASYYVMEQMLGNNN